MKKKLDNKAILVLLSLIIAALCFVIGYITIFSKFGVIVDEYDKITYLQQITEDGTLKEVILVLVMLPLAVIFNAVVFVDVLLRKDASHIAVTSLGGLFAFAYLIANGIYQFTAGGIAGGVFYSLAALGSLVMIYFYFLKMLDGDATLGYEVTGILYMVLAFFGVCSAYPFLDAYSHSGDSLFWTGGFFGISMVIYMAILYYVSFSSDYDPNPIQIDEFGNPVDNNK